MISRSLVVALLLLAPFAASAATDAQMATLEKLKAELTKLQTDKKVLTVAVAPTTWEYFIESNGIPVGSETQEEEAFDDDELVDIFHVYGGKIADREHISGLIDTDDQFIWDLFKSIATEQFAKKHFQYYATFKGAENPVLAYVELFRTKSPAWALVVNANASDLESRRWKRDMAITLVHEYAHVFFMNSTQADLKKKNYKSCTKSKGRYLLYHGCTKKKSYAQAYLNKFWTDAEIAASLNSTGDDYYEDNEGSFITEYAASNHKEDIAEAFVDFVLRAKPTGVYEKDEKTRFFYTYPELVKERERIRAAIGQYF